MSIGRKRNETRRYASKEKCIFPNEEMDSILVSYMATTALSTTVVREGKMNNQEIIWTRSTGNRDIRFPPTWVYDQPAVYQHMEDKED